MLQAAKVHEDLMNYGRLQKQSAIYNIKAFVQMPLVYQGVRFFLVIFGKIDENLLCALRENAVFCREVEYLNSDSLWFSQKRIKL